MKTISAIELKNRLSDDGTLVLDVLPPDHFASEHIPGAKNVPLSLESFIGSVEVVASDKEQPIIVYCANADCDLSPKAVQQLERAGFKNVADFEGGIEAWKEAGFKLARD